jgi:hypothetical protein
LLTGLVLPALLLATLAGLATLLLTTLTRFVLATLLTTLVLLAALLLVLVIGIWIVHRRFPSLVISVVEGQPVHEPFRSLCHLTRGPRVAGRRLNP